MIVEPSLGVAESTTEGELPLPLPHAARLSAEADVVSRTTVLVLEI